MVPQSFDIASIDRLKAVVKELLPLIVDRKIILLSGDLGSGKTALVKAVSKLLDVKETVSSPTFSLINEYLGNYQGKTIPIYHMDLYRIKDLDELLEIGFEEYLDKEALIFIEWPDMALSLIPDNTLLIELEMFDNSTRRLNLSNWSRSRISHSDITPH